MTDPDDRRANRNMRSLDQIHPVVVQPLDLGLEGNTMGLEMRPRGNDMGSGGDNLVTVRLRPGGNHNLGPGGSNMESRGMRPRVVNQAIASSSTGRHIRQPAAADDPFSIVIPETVLPEG